MAWPYKRVTRVVITSISGAIILLITGKGPACMEYLCYIWLKFMVNVRNFPCIDGIHEDHEIRLGKLNACMLNQKTTRSHHGSFKTKQEHG